jgi:hypothetical protein
MARGGGLRGGRWAVRLSRSVLRLHAVELVPGVRVSGTIRRFLGRREHGRLRLAGPGTPAGVLELDRHGIRGRLGGRTVTTRAAAGAAIAGAPQLQRRARQHGRRPRLR